MIPVRQPNADGQQEYYTRQEIGYSGDGRMEAPCTLIKLNGLL